MTIDEIKEQITTALDAYCDEQWFSILDHTSPGHYGAEDIGFTVAQKDVWVDVPARRFSFKNGTLSFLARLGSSREEDGVDVKFSKVVSGLGTFDFASSSSEIIVGELAINEHLDLYEDGKKA